VRHLTNSAAVLADGDLVATYDKMRLPNYGVFDEARYFVSHDRPCVVDVGGVPVGVTICEDLWSDPGPLHDAARAGAEVVLSLNASPYHHGKRAEREGWVRHHATRDGTYVAYCNAVGGHDEVVFDGDSIVCGPDGDVLARGAQFATDLVLVDLDLDPSPRTPNAPQLPGWAGDKPALEPRDEPDRLDHVAEVWAALVLATRDYCHRNGFQRAIIGLSGGIDSALTAAVAAEALGGREPRRGGDALALLLGPLARRRRGARRQPRLHLPRAPDRRTAHRRRRGPRRASWPRGSARTPSARTAANPASPTRTSRPGSGGCT
jgi:NAD+ synthase (glutamine-hydrolysing)